MKFYFFTYTFFLLYFVGAQEIDPNLIRTKIYDTIVNDIIKENPITIDKQFVIDPTINKFKDLEINEFGIKLNLVEYDSNLDFCKKLSLYKCVSKLEIDQYKLMDVYKEGEKEIFPDFYGIYSPIDSWYNLIYFATVKHFEKNATFNFNIIIPVRNVSIEKGKNKERMIFYNFLFNENFEILKFDRKYLFN